LQDEKHDSGWKGVGLAVSRGLAGLLPAIGPLAQEAINAIIPDYRMERVSDFLRILDEKVRTLEIDQERLGKRFTEGESLDLFEDGIQMAARALSSERKHQIAAVLAHSLSDDEVRYAHAKKLLNILRDLTDPEIVFLKAHSLRGEAQREFFRRHDSILRPASREIGGPRSEADRAAIEDAYEQTLMRLGLFAPRGGRVVSPLGRLLLRYIEIEERSKTNSV
jgi:hypothetical protein